MNPTTNLYRWLTPMTQDFMDNGYLSPNQSVDNRVGVIGDTAERITGIKGLSARFKTNVQKGWYSLSTPIWTNFGTTRGLPISCFGTSIGDSMESILRAHAEVGMQTKHGGGTSAFFGNLRERGAVIQQNGESSGSVHFMGFFDTLINLVSQGKTRRGNFAAYLPIDHPDAEEFLKIRTEGFPIQGLSFGVCVPDKFMQAMIDGNKKARGLWGKVLSSRASTGFPYIVWTDNANNGAADVYRTLKMLITHSNLCTEIFLPDNEEESFVCDLSSMNLLYYHEWKDTDAVEILVTVLDAVMTEFIEKAKKIPFMERCVRFAERHRALGVGQLGWHSLLQSLMIPFESMAAKRLNVEIAKNIHDKAYAASEKLAKLFGEPEVLKGFGRRNTTLCAIAPTKSSAFIMGQVSENMEPALSNFYIKDLAKGKYTIKNPYLLALLDKKGHNTHPVWDSILKHGGSVQHLDSSILTDVEKMVFKTFPEISPLEVVQQAAQRQPYIDQGQSINLMIDPHTPAKEQNALLIEAWKLGLKSLYYQYSVNAAQTLGRSLMACASCES